MAQTIKGSAIVAAKKIGINLNKYLKYKSDKLKWCYKCKSWKHDFLFGIDNSRYDKLNAKCFDCSRVKTRRSRVTFQASKLNKTRAMESVRHAIKSGRLSKPTTNPCFNCGNKANVYHHYLGYKRINYLDVRALCFSCHVRAHWD